MDLDFINDVIRSVKQKAFVEDFAKELKNEVEDTVLKQEGCIYQVVDLSLHGAYLCNTKTKKIKEEKDIPKEVLDKIAEDSFLRYENGQYIYDEKLTDEFYKNL